MAKVKVKNTQKFVSTFVKSFNNNLNKNISRIPKDALIDEINSTILSGQSPVKGKRFKEYNEQYAKREKSGRRKPVNLYQTGKMLESLEVTQPRNRVGLLIRFKDALSDIHDRQGAGKSKVIRRMLPRFNEGESFKENIQKKINEILNIVVKNSTR